MLSIRYRVQNSTMSKEDIAVQNLKTIDKYFDSEIFAVCSFGWMHATSNTNFQKLETFLRENDFNTHLVAVKSKQALKYYNSNRTDTPLYECIFSCKPKEAALNEIHAYWESYDKNFKALELAGLS